MGYPVDSRVPLVPWTPVLTFVTPGDLVVAYSSRVGNYIIIGGICFWWLNLATSTFTHTTASGNLRVTGLPIKPISVGNYTGTCRFRGYTKANYTWVVPNFDPLDADIQWEASGSGQTTTELAVADMPTGGTVHIIASGAFPVNNI